MADYKIVTVHRNGKTFQRRQPTHINRRAGSRSGRDRGDDM